MEIEEAIELFAGYIAFCEEHRQDVDLSADRIALQAMEEKALRARKEPNLPLTVEPCWCRDCEHCYTDIDAEDGTKYLRCGNSVSWFIREIVRDKNTCGECKRRKPEEEENGN